MQRIYGSERLEINIQTKSLEKIWNTMDDLIRLSFDLGQDTVVGLFEILFQKYVC